MNPNYNQIPQGQPTPQPLADVATARAMQASRPAARPMQVPTTPAAAQNFIQQAVASAPAPQVPAVDHITGQQPTPFNNAIAGQPYAPQGYVPNGYTTGQPGQQYQQPGQIYQPQPTATMPAEPAKVTENPLSTQSTLMFSELRDSLVIMKDGSFRAVVACQSINFDLMSETEREGVEYSYQNFLNSLNFTIQILVRSQRVDIGPYIEGLAEMRRNNDNMLLGVLMDDYIQFISLLAQEANIMDKSFFIVIPYYSSAELEKAVLQTKNFFKTLSRNSKANEVTRINREVYNKAIEELNNRVESVISGLFQIGIKSVRLNTKELAELFYNFNNPDTAVREPLVDFSKLATSYVQKGRMQ